MHYPSDILCFSSSFFALVMPLAVAFPIPRAALPTPSSLVHAYAAPPARATAANGPRVSKPTPAPTYKTEGPKVIDSTSIETKPSEAVPINILPAQRLPWSTHSAVLCRRCRWRWRLLLSGPLHSFPSLDRLNECKFTLFADGIDECMLDTMSFMGIGPIFGGSVAKWFARFCTSLR